MRKLILFLIVIAVLGGGGYYFYRFGLKTPQIGSLFSSGDSDAMSKVKQSISASSYLSGYDVDVKAEGGVVTLTGKVPSENAKTLAGEIARDTQGVKDVKNLIIVDPTASSAENPHIVDLEIKTMVADALAKSSDLATKKITAEVTNRAVTLAGSVDNESQRAQAEEVAKSVPGVTAVTDNLAIAGSAPPVTGASNNPVDPNQDLAKHIEFELYRTNAFDLSTVTIKADSGNVVLSGTVRSTAEQLLADRIAQGVPGVKKVDNQLKVAPAHK